MKTYHPLRTSLCLLTYIFLLAMNSYGQDCGNGKAASKISYDTLFQGLGNSNYDINFPQFDTGKVRLVFPQFDPSKGTLVQVDIDALITVKYAYELENRDINPFTYTVKMFRGDIISSSVLIEPFEKYQNKTFPTIPLYGADGIANSGPDYVTRGPLYAYNKQAITYNITNNLAGFMGNGQVYFNYETLTNISPTGGTYTWSPTTNDSVVFKLTYHYCLTSILPADISNFSATKSSSGNLQLTWKSPNDNIGNKYEMQKSTNGKDYNSFQTVVSKSSAANNYQVFYTPVSDDKNKVLFRIKQTEADGLIKYSTVKAVDLDYTSSAMKVYPTVAKNSVNIYFPYAVKGDYQVTIVSITGQVMQRSVFLKTNFIKVPLSAGLKAGMYIVSVLNKQTLETQQSKLLVE